MSGFLLSPPPQPPAQLHLLFLCPIIVMSRQEIFGSASFCHDRSDVETLGICGFVYKRLCAIRRRSLTLHIAHMQRRSIVTFADHRCYHHKPVVAPRSAVMQEVGCLEWALIVYPCAVLSDGCLGRRSSPFMARGDHIDMRARWADRIRNVMKDGMKTCLHIYQRGGEGFLAS